MASSRLKRPGRLHLPVLPAFLVAAALFAAALTGFAPAAPALEKNLPVPRFVSLHADKVNLRTGPGTRYPVEWVFTRRDLPVEIIAEFENWRRIRDADGTEGWVQEHMVTGKRTVLIRGQIRVLRAKPRGDASAVARVEPGVIAKLLECHEEWCRIDALGARGWLRRDEFWGVFPNEVIE